MRLYVVLDKTSKIEYGVTNKLWLARLFVIQRYDTNKNLTIDCRKSKKSKHDLIYHDLNLYYFSGFALLYEELQYIHSNIFDCLSYIFGSGKSLFPEIFNLILRNPD